jgi:hypothetical protein
MAMPDSQDIPKGITQGEGGDGDFEAARVARGIIMQSIHSIIFTYRDRSKNNKTKQDKNNL